MKKIITILLIIILGISVYPASLTHAEITTDPFDITNVTATFTAPVVGQNASQVSVTSKTAISTDSHCTITAAKWFASQPKLDDPLTDQTPEFTGTFESGNTYYAKITTEPEEGYRMIQGTDNPTTVTVNGATSLYSVLWVYNYSNPDKQYGVICLSFTPAATHTVTFNTYGGTNIDNQNVAEGQKATKPVDPIPDSTKTGLHFDKWCTVPMDQLTYDNYWYSDGEPGIQGGTGAIFSFNTEIKKDYNLYAGYWGVLELSSYDLSTSTSRKGGKFTYKSPYDQAVSDKITGIQTTNIANTTVTLTAYPDSDYVFAGWSSNTSKDGIVSTANPYSFTFEQRTTVYALFEKESVTHVHDEITFTKWTPTDTLPLPDSSGNYYLASDVTISSTWNVPSGITNFCLNGHGIKYTGTSGSVINVGSGKTLNIYDCDTTTTHRFNVDSNNLATISGSGTNSFTGGYITGGKGSVVYDGKIGGGAIVNEGILNINGGTIIGNIAEKGGGVCNKGTMTLAGGKIMYNAGLLITDGKIENGDGGALLNYQGTFTMTGGEISNNKSVYGGGVQNRSTFTMTGGAIVNNTTADTEVGTHYDKHGSGVYLYKNNTFNLSGNPIISGNDNDNVYVENNRHITVNGALTNITPIGVTMENPGVFTSGLSGKGNASNFSSDSSDYTVTLNSSNEAQLIQQFTVSFDANGHGTAPAEQKINSGGKVTKPDDPSVEGYVFGGWYKEAGCTNAWDFDNNTVTESRTLYAKWTEAVASITNGSTVTNYTDINSAMSVWDEGTTLTLLKDVTVTGGAREHRKTNTLDLNGHTFATTGDYEILLEKTLTIKDSSTSKTGMFKRNAQTSQSLIWAHNGNLILEGGTLSADSTQAPVVDFWNSNNCSFTMNGGKITGSARDGAVRFNSDCSFTMTGGEISELTTVNGVFSGSTSAPLTISGSAVIKNNTRGSKTENVNLASGKVITIGAALDSSASIGVTMAVPGIFTASVSGITSKDYISNFTSDDSNYSVSVSGNELTLTNEKEIQTTVKGYSGTYDGQAHGISVTVTDPSSGAVIKYGTSEGTYNLDNSPTITDVSDSPKTFYYKVMADGYADKTGSATVTISQATNTVTVDIEGWTYGETAKTPTSNATYGTATYTYKEQGSSTYSDTVPTKAGTHTVKASVAGTTNYAAAEATKDFTIAKAAGTVSYETTEVKKVVTDSDFTNPLKKTGDGTVTYSSSNPTAAGVDSDGKVTIFAATDSPITIKATVADGNNYSYESNTAEYTLTISKASPEINADLAASAITYGQSLSEGTFTNATATYDGNPVAGSFAWKEPSTKPAVADSNKTAYTVVFTPTDTDTYASAEVAKTLTVNKADSSVTTSPVANTLTYTGKPQALITGGTAEGGTMKYRCNGNEYSAAIPAGLDAGKYTVYYIVEGDENHNNTDPQSVEVTINSADPSTLVPEGYVVNAEVLETLGNLTLPEGLKWADPYYVISAAGTHYLYAKATDTNNYQDTPVIITVKASVASYGYVEGSSSCQWTKGASGTLPFTFKRSMNDKKTFDSFTGALCDGKEMTKGVQYTVKAGSLIISLNDSMLNSLSVGTHVLKVTFKDGEAVTTFRVIEKSSGGGDSSKDYNPPKTGIE